MISPAAFAALVWGSVTLVVAVFGYVLVSVVRSHSNTFTHR